jgi:hypothetical protein
MSVPENQRKDSMIVKDQELLRVRRGDVMERCRWIERTMKTGALALICSVFAFACFAKTNPVQNASTEISNGSPHKFRNPTPRDRALAQLAADWIFHDDWHAPIPTNAYAQEWQKDIPKSRDKLRKKYATIPIEVESSTNVSSLLTYNVKDRLLADRSDAPDPWPTPRINVMESTSADKRPQLVVRWSGGLWYYLGVREATNGPVVVSIDDRRHVD